ncbi:MAG: GtrA family protein [Candidatus Limnocylindrales bacterium]|jgi:putative flippase GtrA
MTALPVPARFAARRAVVRQLASFGVIGVASTLAYVGLYAWLRQAAPAAIANAVALLLTAVGNTAANRWLTFGIRGSQGLARHHAAGLLALGAALAITSASLVILNAVAPNHGRLTEIAILVAANALATLIRFLFLRLAIDRPPATRSAAPNLAVDRAADARGSASPTVGTLFHSKGTPG